MATVLVADDDASVRSVVKSILASGGYAVLEAPDGPSALELARARHPDVILIDIKMPHMDGFAVLRELGGRGGGDHRVLILTGAVEEEDYMRGWGLGADGYIGKPFEPEELISAVERVLALTPTELQQQREREIARARLLRQLNRFLEQRPRGE